MPCVCAWNLRCLNVIRWEVGAFYLWPHTSACFCSFSPKHAQIPPPLIRPALGIFPCSCGQITHQSTFCGIWPLIRTCLLHSVRIKLLMWLKTKLISKMRTYKTCTVITRDYETLMICQDFSLWGLTMLLCLGNTFYKLILRI